MGKKPEKAKPAKKKLEIRKDHVRDLTSEELDKAQGGMHTDGCMTIPTNNV